MVAMELDRVRCFELHWSEAPIFFMSVDRSSAWSLVVTIDVRGLAVGCAHIRKMLFSSVTESVLEVGVLCLFVLVFSSSRLVSRDALYVLQPGSIVSSVLARPRTKASLCYRAGGSSPAKKREAQGSLPPAMFPTMAHGSVGLLGLHSLARVRNMGGPLLLGLLIVPGDRIGVACPGSRSLLD